MKASQPFAHWQQVRSDLIRALDLLEDRQLAFVPAPGLWSLGTVAWHIAEAEVFWFRTVIGGLPEEEVNPGPEPATVAEIKAGLARTHEATLAYLATLDEAALGHELTTSWGESLSLYTIVWHVLEHEIHHRGEIYLMLGLQGMQAPEI